MQTIADRTSERTKFSADALHAELALLQARYDSGTVSPAVYSVGKALETDIAWLEKRGRL